MPTVHLNSRRVVGYGDLGPKDGVPLIFFHGSIGSRLEGCWDFALLYESGVRLITVERPGYGVTQPLAHPSYRAYAQEASDVLRHLGLKSFYILGFSCGGAHALAFARWHPERLVKVFVVGSVRPYPTLESTADMSPINHHLFELAFKAPDRLIDFAANAAQDVPALYSSITGQTCSSDRALFEREEFSGHFKNNMSESFKQGGIGAAHDYLLMSRPWGFDLQEIDVPVEIWHGGEDATVPIAHGRHLMERLPCATFHEVPDAGHFFLFSSWQSALQRVPSTGGE